MGMLLKRHRMIKKEVKPNAETKQRNTEGQKTQTKQRKKTQKK